MTTTPVPCRTMCERTFRSSRTRANPFLDVTIDAVFTGPAGEVYTMPAFYDGDQTWRVRFNPSTPGQWHYRTVSRPSDPDLDEQGVFDVVATAGRGFLRATPGQDWGFHYESAEPALIWGDTTYNLFGMAHCGADTESFIKRRASQGFNLLRVRLPVSLFHPPAGLNDWQTRRTWPWGGSEQAPRFDQFNLDYFRSVDRVVQQAERAGVGLEMIMEAWGSEFPFNSRQIFTAEWEELWMRYLIARYDAYNSVYFWTPLNEYEFYPNGDWHYKLVADRWAMRIARWIKATAPHGHIVSIHNGPREPAFAQRFAADPGAIDTILFQEWGARDEQHGWLASGIEEQIGRSLAGWWGSAVYAEYGYERNPQLDLRMPGHAFCGPDHTRRATLRGLFCGLGVIHGFENSWGPWQKLEQDQPGMVYLAHIHRFFTETVPFHTLLPRQDILAPGDWPVGERPLALAAKDGAIMLVYLPTGGTVRLVKRDAPLAHCEWFDPRRGTLSAAEAINQAGTSFSAPEAIDDTGHAADWILVLRSSS